MILVEAVRDARLGKGAGILPVEGHRRGVVMNLSGIDLELLDDVQRQTKEEAAG